MFVTKHSTLKTFNTLVTGLVNQLDTQKISSYLDLLSKFLRTFLSNAYRRGTHTIWIHTDFIKLLPENKREKFCIKFAHLLK